MGGAGSGIVVSGLAIAPVKGLRLCPVDSVVIGEHGVRANRRFFLIDARERMVNANRLGVLETVVADYSDADRVLSLTFPDGDVVAGEVALGSQVEPRFYSSSLPARLVEGPWSAALSALVGQPLRLVEPLDEAGSVDRGSGGAVSLISRASLDRLASEAGTDSVDARRFRMLVEIDGVDAHAEDVWVGRVVQIGEATVRFAGHVGRCRITSRHPETGVTDLPTLDLLRSYRRDEHTTEPLPFGIYGDVRVPGVVRVGDAVALDGAG